SLGTELPLARSSAMFVSVHRTAVRTLRTSASRWAQPTGCPPGPASPFPAVRLSPSATKLDQDKSTPSSHRRGPLCARFNYSSESRSVWGQAKYRAKRAVSEDRDDVLGIDVRRDIHSLDVKLGNRRELDPPALHDRAYLRDRGLPVLGLLVIGQHAEPGVPGVIHQHPVVSQEVRRQLPESLGRGLPQDHRKEDKTRPELARYRG